MKIQLLRGGSGKWQLTHDGRKLASGHVPKKVEGEEFTKVALRQIKRFAYGGEYQDMSWACLGGGYLYDIEVPDEVIFLLLEKERKYSENRAWEEALYIKEVLRLREFEALGYEIKRYWVGAYEASASLEKDGNYVTVRKAPGSSGAIEISLKLDHSIVIQKNENIVDPFGDSL